MFTVNGIIMKKLLYIATGFIFTQASAFAAVTALPQSWTGIYNDEQKISLFFKQNGNQLTGYSVLQGKVMNFTGTLNANGKIALKEKGSGNSAGFFDFQYKPSSSKMEGSWRSSTGNVKPKFFSVDSQQCRYAKGEGEYPYTSTRLLKDADLQMSLEELQYMRNEIYARQGYAFTNKNWAITFSDQDWYMPCYTDVESRLSGIEKQNIQRIKSVEPYAKKMDWGR